MNDESNIEEMELTVHVLDETEKAYKVFDGDTEAWIPKSLIVLVSPTANVNVINIVIPEWLAEKKGLV